MRLFFYYVSHSLLNTLKKLLKTWVAVFLVLAVGGAVIGGIIGLIASAVIKEDEPEQNTTISITEEGEETDDDAEIHLEFSFGNEISAKMKEYGVSTVDVVDLVISVLFLVVLATNVVNAKSSGKIFQPADVPMLFASPLRPQSVLMFRLLCTLGSSIFVSFFMLYQVPNLMNGAKLGFWGALSCVVVYMLILMFSTLVQVTFYTITSKFDNGIELTNKILIGIYGLIGAGFAAYVTLSKKELVPAVFGYFAGTKTHWVPFWGWLRGIAYYASKNDLAMSGVYMGLFVAACFFLILFIWKMKADFYEDAMFATERKAEALENAQRASNGATVIREKERKGKIDREGFRYGSGANVFFYKAVYNRFRFAKLNIFSTTMIVYLISAVTISYVVKNYATGFDDMFFIPAAAMGIIAFYRTLGDPIREDTRILPSDPRKGLHEDHVFAPGMPCGNGDRPCSSHGNRRNNAWNESRFGSRLVPVHPVGQLLCYERGNFHCAVHSGRPCTDYKNGPSDHVPLSGDRTFGGSRSCRCPFKPARHRAGDRSRDELHCRIPVIAPSAFVPGKEISSNFIA